MQNRKKNTIETNNVLLVNEQDKPIGEMEKLVAQEHDGARLWTDT